MTATRRRALLLWLALCSSSRSATRAQTSSLPSDQQQLQVSLLSLHAGDPGSADVQLQWQPFTIQALNPNDLLPTTSNDPVVAYEAQFTPSGADAWVSLSAQISGLRGAGSSTTGRHEKQRILTRVDAGQTLAGGFFRLSLSHAHTSPLDLRQRAVSPPIAFDASTAQLQQALEALDVVSSVHVVRRVLDAASGAVEWTVRFDSPSRESNGADRGDLPLLTLHSDALEGGAYSGPGDRVAIQSVRDGAGPELVCLDACVYTARALPVGAPLAFRVRAQFARRGWSRWSRASEPLPVPSTPLPHAPSAPTLLAASASRLVVQWTTNQAVTELFPILSFQLQQRCGYELSWRSSQRDPPPGPAGPLTVSATAASLLPNTTCWFRVSAANANGAGPFSAPSAPFRTNAAAPSPPRRLAVSRGPLRLTWQPPTTDGGSAVLGYELQLRAFASSTWLAVANDHVNATSRTVSCALDDLALAPHTRYSARVRARTRAGASAFVDFPDFLTDDRATRADSSARSSSWSSSSSSTTTLTAAASRHQAANTLALHYIHGVGNGGRTLGEDGEPGAVVLFPLSLDGQRLDEQVFYFTGAVQSFRVPLDEDPRRQVVAVDVSAWGAGGGSGGKIAWGRGGGGAFARGVFRVAVGDHVQVFVGEAGQGMVHGGRGGWNGGGDGGAGGSPGGGGGGASELKIGDTVVLVAGGGGGGGSSDYCCAHGGGGGGSDGGGRGGGASTAAESGLFPDASSIPLDSRLTGVTRNEFHATTAQGDLRDVVGLPARHLHADWGFAAASADYTTLATGDGGASASEPGRAGQPASFVGARFGQCVVNADSRLLGVVSGLAAASQATGGRRGRGGKGQDGLDCGGGGGGGYFGGGAGGAGVDGAGGGGGSSYVALDRVAVASVHATKMEERVDKLAVRSLSSTAVFVSWREPLVGFQQPVQGFVVEMAERRMNENFRVKRVLPATASNLTLDALRPAFGYRVRVRPLFRDAAVGVYGDVRAFQTPPAPWNAWVRVRNVRALDERTTHAGSRALLDARPMRRRPSARRGHSLTAFEDGFLYLFGGFSGGYACNSAHKAACTVHSGVNNELWRFDPRLRSWTELSTLGGAPPAREKHSMAVVSSHLLLFGGRSSGANDAPTALGDLWSLQLSSTTRKTTTTSLRDRQSSVPIRDGRESFTVGNVGHAPDMCVADLVVSLELTHACAQTLRIELLGPGPSTHPHRQQSATSPIDAHSVETTWSASTGFVAGQQRVTPAAPSARSFPVTLQLPEPDSDDTSKCLSGPRTLTFSSGSSSSDGAGALAVFRQLSAAGGWTLSVVDTAQDGHTGSLLSWDIAFTLAPCVPTATWTNVGAAATGTAPTARFQHTAIVYQTSLFVLGGRSATGATPLADLHRLDYNAASNSGAWTALLPLTTTDVDRPFYFHGGTLLVTPFELLVVGRGRRDRRTTAELSSAVVDVARKSAVETRGAWHHMHIQGDAEDKEGTMPLRRSWSSAVFTSEPTPRVVLFGGQDDTALLSDLWRLRLDALAEVEPLADRETKRQESCAWRLANAAYQQMWVSSCGATSAMVAANATTECSLDALLLYAWCSKAYQAIQL